MNTITPFKGLELVVTIKDDNDIFYLLDPNKEGLQLVCDDCSGKSFEIKTLIDATLDISVSSRHSQAILRNHEIKSISAIKVIRCATCGSEDFIRETGEHGRVKNEQKSNGVGEGIS